MSTQNPADPAAMEVSANLLPCSVPCGPQLTATAWQQMPPAPVRIHQPSDTAEPTQVNEAPQQGLILHNGELF